MRLGILCFILTYDHFLTVSGKNTCPWSRQTVEKVDACPVNETAVEKRKERKNCEALAKRQNCTDSKKFSYHCVMSENENTLIEVCAPEYNIIGGYCAEYNTLGEGIFPNFNVPCSDLTPPCDLLYISTDAYKYQGCYAAIKRTTKTFNTNTTPTAERTSTIRSSSKNGQTSQELVTTITVAVVVCVAAITILVILVKMCVWLSLKKRARQNRRVEEWFSNEGMTVLVPLLQTEELVSKDQLDRSISESIITRAEILRSTVLDEGETVIENMENCEGTTKELLDYYRRANEAFFETRLTLACKEKLNKFGFVVLTGKQGSGKTSTAIHIMSDQEYNEWKTLKVTSWEDLLVFEFKENTLIYIDNLFDGFVYYLDVDKWWDSLFYFYFKRIRQICNIRLMITAKKIELEKACAFIKPDVQTIIRACLVEVESFSLTHEEKIGILNSQIKLANLLGRSNTPFIGDSLNLELEDVTCPVGFPLCAHMYAFEEKQTDRDVSIFKSPRSYVRNQIFQRSEADQTGGVKTLFLLIIFYSCSEPSNAVENLDLKDEDDCKSYLEDKCPAELIQTLKPLSFANLYEIAEDLKETVLIKHNQMFQFKHQIYLEGAVDYFSRKYFDAVVEHFPLSILRAYEMKDFSENQIPTVIKRMKREIPEGKISEALSCKVFQEFEQVFCNEIQKDTQSMTTCLSAADEASRFKYPVIFWANKYNLLKLSKSLMDFAKQNNENEHLQFYRAMFGECCAYDEDFIKHAKDGRMDKMEELQNLVREFKTSEGMTILHLILSSKRSDDDAYQCLKRILTESKGHHIKFDKSLIDCVLKQNKYSRLLCLFEVLQNVPKSGIKDRLYISILEKELELACSAEDDLLELEVLCRISILLVHGASGFTRKSCNGFFNNRNDYPKVIPPNKSRMQQNMADRIMTCLKKLDRNTTGAERIHSLKIKIAPNLMTVLKECIAILAEKEEKFISK